MLNAMPLSLAALIIVIGCFYLVSPERISGSFGLKPPASDAVVRVSSGKGNLRTLSMSKKV